MTAGRIPSLNWLRVFEAAARVESFSQAAQILNMSVPAVSQQIRALESHLGKALFHRSARRVQLTEAGLAFLPVVSNALASIETTASTLFGRADAEPLTVRVSAMLAESWLAERVCGFMRRHPEVALTLLAEPAVPGVRRPGADLEIAFGAPPGPGEQGDALFGERLIPVARPDLAARIVEPGDLARHCLIEVSSHRANWYRLLPDADRLPASPQFLFTDTTAIALALARDGVGIALARAPASDRLVQQYGLAPCPPATGVPGTDRYYLVYPAQGTLRRGAAAFRAWLLEQAAAAQAGGA
jgi:LysR family glycine cleavage system transcriptional activator